MHASTIHFYLNEINSSVFAVKIYIENNGVATCLRIDGFTGSFVGDNNIGGCNVFIEADVYYIIIKVSICCLSLDATLDGKSFLACAPGTVFGFYRLACQRYCFRIGFTLLGSQSGKTVAEE